MNILAIAVLPFIATREKIPLYRGQIMNVVEWKDSNSSVVPRAARARNAELLSPFGI
jgi:hypothetical protein